jgi:hypothetical protein
MAYGAEISRISPAALIFLLDQSASMQEPFGGSEQRGDAAPSRARALADIMNRLLHDLILRCAKEDGVRDYFHVGLIGYGDTVGHLVQPGSVGSIGGLLPVSALAEHPLRIEERSKPIEDGSGADRKVKHPVWFDPKARNGTPMCQALDLAAHAVRDWIDAHPDAYPPIVVNITDGEATDGDPLRYAGSLREFATTDGEVLLFNLHLSASQDAPVAFPSSIDEVPEADFARNLFQMSSVLPFGMRSAAEADGYRTDLDTRGFVFNADPASLVRFLEIGTRPPNLR